MAKSVTDLREPFGNCPACKYRQLCSVVVYDDDWQDCQLIREGQDVLFKNNFQTPKKIPGVEVLGFA